MLRLIHIVRFSTVLVLCSILNVANVADIYVSPKGKDTNKGTKKQPLASMLAAKNEANWASRK